MSSAASHSPRGCPRPSLRLAVLILLIARVVHAADLPIVVRPAASSRQSDTFAPPGGAPRGGRPPFRGPSSGVGGGGGKGRVCSSPPPRAPPPPSLSSSPASPPLRGRRSPASLCWVSRG